MMKWGEHGKDRGAMATESIALSPRFQGSLLALKQAAEAEAAIVQLVTQAVRQGGQTLSSPASTTTATDPSRLLDIVV